MIIVAQEINGFDFLFLSGNAGIYFSHSLSKILSVFSVEDLILKIRPIILGLRFSINGYNNPFKDLISFGFSIININFYQFFSINFGSNLNSFLPLSKVFLFICFDLLFVFAFFVIIFKISLIDFYFAF